jgi:hypothetical protein
VASRTERQGRPGDLVAEAFELPDQALGVGRGVVAAEQIVWPEVRVGPAALQDIVGDGEDGMRDGPVVSV